MTISLLLMDLPLLNPTIYWSCFQIMRKISIKSAVVLNKKSLKFDSFTQLFLCSKCFYFTSKTKHHGLTCHSRSEEHTSELQSRPHLVCRLLLEKKKKKYNIIT